MPRLPARVTQHLALLACTRVTGLSPYRRPRGTPAQSRSCRWEYGCTKAPLTSRSSVVSVLNILLAAPWIAVESQATGKLLAGVTTVGFALVLVLVMQSSSRRAFDATSWEKRRPLLGSWVNSVGKPRKATTQVTASIADRPTRIVPSSPRHYSWPTLQSGLEPATLWSSKSRPVAKFANPNNGRHDGNGFGRFE
jgi:hypothetical protein